MKAGDLLLVVPGTQVKPGTRYSQGVVLKILGAQKNIVKVAWCDGRIELEELKNVLRYYVRIGYETR